MAVGAQGKPLPHESAVLHVTGQARYTDDTPLPARTVFIALGLSSMAHAQIQSMDLDAVRSAPGVHAVFTAQDFPASAHFTPTQDEPILALEEVHYAGQPLFAVAAHTQEAARRAVRMARVQYTPLPALLDIPSALAAQHFVLPSRQLARGAPDTHLADAVYRLEGHIEMGGQDHFYLEGQIALALPQEDGGMRVLCSTQHPSEVQHLVAHLLGQPCNAVVVECRRMGGGFGGKESQPALFACIAAWVAQRLQCPALLRLDRDDDMRITGKRHDFQAEYQVGFDAMGRIQALQVELAARCGHSIDLSGPVNDRAMFHIDNAYFLEHIRILSHRCRTHTVSNTAFRGFGGPQGMLVIETILEDIARHLGLDALTVRQNNLYGRGTRDVTPYGMHVEDNCLPELLQELTTRSAYWERRAAIHAFNAEHRILKRGLALTPVKFGISFTATHFNQAGALVQVYTDGSILLHHGGTEMGQGLHTKIRQIVADVFTVPVEQVRVSTTDTSKVPNTSATAASSGTDLNGQAAADAARQIRARLTQLASQTLGLPPETLQWQEAQVGIAGHWLTFTELVQKAYAARIALFASGFYRTPKIHYDRASMQGRPFYYFAYGAAVAEVVVDTLTGEHRLLRVDILHDAGRSLNPAIDRGQIEGGFLQGVGWLTSEELVWDADGQLRTHAPSTYKIPAVCDWPTQAHIHVWANHPNQEDVIFGAKAVGEPPLMLAISVWQALRDAVAAVGGPQAAARLRAPATPEAVWAALHGGSS